MSLEGKRVVLLGGSSGIGLATAAATARQRAAVVVVSSSRDGVEQALATLPAGAEGRSADLTSEEEIRALFEGLGPFD